MIEVFLLGNKNPIQPSMRHVYVVSFRNKELRQTHFYEPITPKSGLHPKNILTEEIYD